MTGLRDGWAIAGVTVLLLFTVEGLSRLAIAVNNRDPSDRAGGLDASILDPRQAASAYRQATWTAKYYQELRESSHTEWQPYVYWRRRPFAGRWINVSSEGLRRTWQSTKQADDPPFRIFCFGGSTMWGTGARDDFTVPSLISRQLSEQGYQVEVTNFGESGYVLQQEFLTFTRELAAENAPDLVLFYDGVNDTFSAYQNRVAGIPQNESNRRREFNSLQRASLSRLMSTCCPGLLRLAASARNRLRPPPSVDDQPQREQQLADDVITHYKATRALVRDLAAAREIQTLFYWQPTVYTKRRLSEDEKAFNWRYEPFFREVYRRCRADAELRKADDFRDLSEIFAEQRDSFYIDWCHLAEAGNEIVAEVMVSDIREVIDSRRDHLASAK